MLDRLLNSFRAAATTLPEPGLAAAADAG
jgi:hypothetical protein